MRNRAASTSKIKDQELAKIEEELCEWRAPIDLDLFTGELLQKYGLDFWDRGRFKKAHEAGSAGQYGRVLNASVVRMQEEPTKWPDFWLRIDDEEIPFELVGVHNPEANIFKWLNEQRKASEQGQNVPPPEIDLRVVERDLVEWISTEVSKKREKAERGNYVPGTVLAVHVHFEVPLYIADAIFRAASISVSDHVVAFRAIVVIAGPQIYIHDIESLPYKRLNPVNIDVGDHFRTRHELE